MPTDTFTGTNTEKIDQLIAVVAELRVEFRSGLAEVRGELRAGLAEVRGELRAGLAEVRGELGADIRSGLAEVRGESRADIRELRTAINIYTRLLAIAASVVLGMIAYQINQNAIILAEIRGLSVRVGNLEEGQRDIRAQEKDNQKRLAELEAAGKK